MCVRVARPRTAPSAESSSPDSWNRSSCCEDSRSSTETLTCLCKSRACIAKGGWLAPKLDKDSIDLGTGIQKNEGRLQLPHKEPNKQSRTA